MNIKIRKIEESDFTELISLFKEFALFEKAPEKMTNTIEKMKDDKEFINGFVAVSEKNKILGYATFFFVYFTWTGKSLYMDDLYVKNDFRGNGIGTLLIDEVINFAKKEKCKKLHWQVSDWNKAAIEFYKKLGAQVDSVESNCDLIL
jgi:ribosomal protein S18 acetylase RimI-like enzyme